MKQSCLLPLLMLVLLFSCRQEPTTIPSGKVTGYKPVYSNSPDLYLIRNTAARPVKNAGKIYVKDNYIFQNEIGEGIHIINNSNPANAVRTSFIQIMGSEEISIRGNYLYSNNISDLVVIDISNINQVKEVNRIKNTFYGTNFQLAPPAVGNFFECADKSKGVVTGWVIDSISNPACRN